MRALASTNINNDLLRTLWIQRLPSQMQAILSTSGEEVDKLSVMADKICEITNVAEIGAISTVKSSESFPINQIEALTKSINGLRARLDTHSTGTNKGSRLRSSSRNRISENKSDSQSQCWYHRKFGTNATKCRPPCNFESRSKN